MLDETIPVVTALTKVMRPSLVSRDLTIYVEIMQFLFLEKSITRSFFANLLKNAL